MQENIQSLKSELRNIMVVLGNPTLRYVLAGKGKTSVKTNNRKRMVTTVSGTAFLNPDFVVV